MTPPPSDSINIKRNKKGKTVSIRFKGKFAMQAFKALSEQHGDQAVQTGTPVESADTVVRAGADKIGAPKESAMNREFEPPLG